MPQPVGYATLLLLLLNYGQEGVTEHTAYCALQYLGMPERVVYVCCAGYDYNPWPTCVPQCLEVACGANEVCAAPNVCACSSGYSRLAAGEDCQPICHEHCAEHAQCVAPHRCACKLGYIPIRGDCISICAEGYVWNDSLEGCEVRCRQSSTWDALAQMCVQRLEAQAQLIAYQGSAGAAAKKLRTFPTLQRQEQKLAEEHNTETTPSIGQNLQFYATENATESGAPSDRYPLPLWLNIANLLIALAVLTLLLSFSYMGHYLWQRRRNQQILILQNKNRLSAEYELDRSQLMVY